MRCGDQARLVDMGPQPRLASLHSMNESPASRDWMKRVTRNLVLNLVKSAGPISRKEIADRSGLSPATITNLTAELIAEDLVHEIGSGEATRGRPPVLLRLNTRAGFVAISLEMCGSLAGVITRTHAGGVTFI